MRSLLGYLFLFGGIAIALFVWYRHSPASTTPRPFSSHAILSSSWQNYKKQFINKDGRVIDYSNNAITTSEGQSYALLRSVWVDDKETFDTVWHWTKTTLKRKEDNLFGWKWGKREDGTFGFSKDSGTNSAPDADCDIAFALILASKRWSDKKYLDDAKKIIADIWKYDTEVAAGKRYIIGGNWAKSDAQLIINPSYFSPAEFKYFAKVDKKNDWNGMIEPGYKLLMDAGKEGLDKSQGAGLPPNWVAIDRKTGELSAPHATGLNTDYSYDALRVPWRIAVDYDWNKDERALTYLSNSFNKLDKDYTSRQQLAAGYTHDGQALSQNENPAMYATFLSYLLIKDPHKARQLYEQKIIKLYSTDQNTFNKNLPYYEQNWLWFGTAFYNKRIVQL